MSDQADPSPRDVLHVEAKHDDTGATIVVVGEFDMAGTERFWSCLSEALAAQPTALTVDASRLVFVDSSG